MAKAKTSGRGAYIGDVLKARMLELGMDAAELAALTGFSETHIINLRNDNKRASLDAIQVIAPHIGMVVAALIPNGGVEPLPEALGTVAAYGFVDLIESDSMMPATLVVMAPCFEWQAGDVLWFRRGGYEAGKYLIVRGIEGKVAIVRAFDEGGKRWLDTGRGDTMQYRPAAHTVVGVIARSVRDH